MTHAPEISSEDASNALKSEWGVKNSAKKLTRYDLDPGMITCIENSFSREYKNSDRKKVANLDSDEAYKRLTSLIYSMGEHYERIESSPPCIIN